MKDVRLVEKAAGQFNRISRVQLHELGIDDNAIAHRVRRSRLVAVEQGVYAIPPVADDDWGRFMGATLTAPRSVLSHASAAAAWGFWDRPRAFETVTRPGSGGPRRHGGVLTLRSTTLAGDVAEVRGVAVTAVPRTLLDLTGLIGERALARALREALRLRVTGISELADRLAGPHRGRRGSARLAHAVSRYSGLPVHRARSGAEVRALEVLRDDGFTLPRLNVVIAGEEADLSWPRALLIIEIDGGPFHLDVGEDGRKEERWRAAGWSVRRISSDDVYERPQHLIALANAANVPRQCL